MNVLVIGSGGREHALVWKLKESPRCGRVFCAPGNAGISAIAECVPIKATDLGSLGDFASSNAIDLTVVGPEQPLTMGIVDLFMSKGLRIFGPTKAAAELEGSKSFAKEFMRKYGIPTAEFRTFSAAERFDAERYVSEMPVPVVIKASGLAAGKGVSVCDTKEEALEVLRDLLDRKTLGEAGEEVVVEEFLAGEEASVFAITDGKRFVTLPAAQDHKRILDHDRGKNTGGMGAYAPAPVVTGSLLREIESTIVAPTIRGMAAEGRPYRGCLYVGLMITPTGPRVIEYNCRFGDPETQVVLPLIDDDLAELMAQSADGALTGDVRIGRKTAVCVVIASGGYPDRYKTGQPIFGLDNAEAEEDVVIFHAGTGLAGDKVVTAGGRVLGVTAVGQLGDLEQTITKAYRAVERITFDGAYYRSDIGKKGLKYYRPHSGETA